jgi:hypothetical protein
MPGDEDCFSMLGCKGRSGPELVLMTCWIVGMRETYGEVPAWKRKGVRCGDGSTMCLDSKLKYLPWWLICRTLSGSI